MHRRGFSRFGTFEKCFCLCAIRISYFSMHWAAGCIFLYFLWFALRMHGIPCTPMLHAVPGA